MNFVEQYFVSFYLIALLVCDSGKVKFDEVLDMMTRFPQSPVERVESAAEVDDLTLLASFLLFVVFPREENCTSDERSRSNELPLGAYLQELFHANFDSFDTRVIAAVDFWSFSVANLHKVSDIFVFIIIELYTASFGL